MFASSEASQESDVSDVVMESSKSVYQLPLPDSWPENFVDPRNINPEPSRVKDQYFVNVSKLFYKVYKF